MINMIIVSILVNRIRSGGLNPKTGEPLKPEDIKMPTYRKAVEDELIREVV